MRSNMLRRACLLCLTASLTCSGYETKWFTQSLTHVPSDTRTFRQRYLVETHGNNAVLFSREPRPNRRLLGERGLRALPRSEAGRRRALRGSALLRRERSRALRQVAQGGLILADYANLVTQLVPAESPVVVFGGSYGGTLATFLRLTYPDTSARLP